MSGFIARAFRPADLLPLTRLCIPLSKLAEDAMFGTTVDTKRRGGNGDIIAVGAFKRRSCWSWRGEGTSRDLVLL